MLLHGTVGILIWSAVAALASPSQVHLTWQNDPATTITVQWAAPISATTGFLEYGMTEGTYMARVEAEVVDYEGASHRFFVAEARGLQPATLYHYRVAADNQFTDDRTFTTAQEPRANARFKFVAAGDSRGGYEYFSRAMQAMAQEGPDFILFSGDATLSGNEEEWDVWFSAAEPVISKIPLMPTYGNHDALANNYFARFALPRNAPPNDVELYYSFVYGNTRFIILNDNYTFALRPSRLDGPQYVWLENELAHAKEEWIIVVNHQPFYSSSNKHGSDRNLQRVWAPLFDKYKVDMVFNGHDHNYERSHPLREGKVMNRFGEGTVYVVAAGIGAPLYDNGRNYFTAYSEKTENYVVVEIDGRKLSYTAKRASTGTVIDQFEYVKAERRVLPEDSNRDVRGVFRGPLWSCATVPLRSLWPLVLTLVVLRLRLRLRALKEVTDAGERI